MADELTLELPGGRLTLSRDAVAEIVGSTALACYGVVGLTAASRMQRFLHREGVTVDGSADALRLGLHVVVEHGLNLAEVAATVRRQVGWEVARLTGLTVESVEVVVQQVRQS